MFRDYTASLIVFAHMPGLGSSSLQRLAMMNCGGELVKNFPLAYRLHKGPCFQQKSAPRRAKLSPISHLLNPCPQAQCLCPTSLTSF